MHTTWMQIQNCRMGTECTLTLQVPWEMQFKHVLLSVQEVLSRF